MKFDVWNTKNKKWEQGIDFVLQNDGHLAKLLKTQAGDGFDDFEYFYYHRCIPVFYIGLKDKTGKEIREGDIIKAVTDETEITYHEVQWCIDLDYAAYDLLPALDCECNSLSYAVTDCCTRIEIIGNKYEHPTLLEQEKENENTK